MRIALVGREADDAVIEALADLGMAPVVYVPGEGERPGREERRGWRREYCPVRDPQQPGSSWTFRDTILARLSEAGPPGTVYDVVHALDGWGRPAAQGLVERHPRTVVVASVDWEDLAGQPLSEPWVSRWVCDHPWLRERWADAECPPTLIPGPALLPSPPAQEGERDGSGSLIVVFWLPRTASPDPEAILRAVSQTRLSVSGVSAIVLGVGSGARAVHERLGRVGLLHHSGRRLDEATPESWIRRVAAATVMVTIGEDPSSSPTAWACWLRNVPVLGHDGRDAATLTDRLREILEMPGQAGRDLQGGLALARSRLRPSSVAQGWLALYLEARTGIAPQPTREPPVSPGTGGRSRLALFAVGPREVLATWHVRPEDRAIALGWLGSDAPRAALALRLHDLTDDPYLGAMAHLIEEIELSPFERARRLTIPNSGRLLGASLILKVPRGSFLPLTHAAPIPLPADDLVPRSARPRLRALSRSAVVEGQLGFAHLPR